METEKKEVELIVDYANRIFPPLSWSKEERYGWTTKGNIEDWRSYELVSVRKLKRDPNYQRPISKSVTNTITKEFDYVRFEPLKVNINTMCIVDGGNRATAAVRRGMEFVPVIYFDWTKRQEAEYFIKLNEKKNLVSAVQMFNAELCEGIKDSIAIKKMCDEIGITICTSHGKKGQCQFIGQIKSSYAKSPENTRRALVFTSYMAKEQALNGYVFVGAFNLLQHGVDLTKWAEKCYLAGGQIAIISNYREIKIMSPRIGDYIASRDAILKIINKGLRRNKVYIQQ